MIAGWVDGYRITMSTQLTISLIALALAAVFAATVWYIAHQIPEDNDEDTVEGHRVDWNQ